MATQRPRPPSVERVLRELRPRVAPGTDPAALLEAARESIRSEAERLAAGAPPTPPAELAEAAVMRLDGFVDPGVAAAINATGVVVHTNLGRAPWPEAAIRAVADLAADALLLELDRGSGRRGARFRQAEEHLVALTGAEDALVTNNNAAAVALGVALAGRRGGVAVSRGELVEIGGGVRIPEIVRRAGGRLVEVGTTNRTRAEDFREPLATGRARLVLRVHRSNFRLEGFTEDPDAADVARLAHEHGAIVVDDLGGGALLDTVAWGLPHEPMPRERLAAGADVVTFSGDKLVGGPQAGLVVGRADLVARMRRDPLARAMRPDKTTLVAVAATLGLYRAGRAPTEVPVWRMIAASPDALHDRARAVADATGAEPIEVRSTVGGGSLPEETLPSWAVRLPAAAGSPAAVLARLRTGTPAVVARIERDAVVLDLRTVRADRDAELIEAIRTAVRPAAGRRSEAGA